MNRRIPLLQFVSLMILGITAPQSANLGKAQKIIGGGMASPSTGNKFGKNCSVITYIE